MVPVESLSPPCNTPLNISSFQLFLQPNIASYAIITESTPPIKEKKNDNKRKKMIIKEN